MEGAFAILATIIVVYLALLIQALWQPPAARAPHMSVPVEESMDQFANYLSELVTGHRRSNARIVLRQNSYLCDTTHSFLLLSMLSCYVALYLLLGQMPEDIPVRDQEPIQCTNRGNEVSIIGGKDYPPPT